MSGLPKGWAEVRTDEAGDIDLGRQRSPKYHAGTNMKPYLRVANVFEDRIDASDVKSMHFEPNDFERFRLHSGEVLLNEGQSPEFLGRPAIYRGEPPEVAFTNSLIRFKPNEAVTPEWALSVFRHHMHSGRFARESRITTNIAHLSAGRLAAVEFRVPPVAEQKRIVAAVEEAFSKLDVGETGLRTLRKLLKRMRDVVLAAAVSGRLVPQDPTDTPAGKLLADIGTEPLSDGDLPTLPISWAWTRVQDVGVVDLGRQRSPKYHRGSNMKPYLRVANVFEDRIDTSDVKEMHFEPEAFERSKLAAGDILLNEGQTPELLGRPAMYRGEPPGVAFTNSLLRFKCGIGIEPEWALLVFRNHMHSGRFTRESRITTNIAHLSASRFKMVEFPVPPTAEQGRIVTEVERQFSFIEACERALDAGLARASALRRSVLRAAFEGKLVPQDPADEPASVLLERIRGERAALNPKARPRSPSK